MVDNQSMGRRKPNDIFKKSAGLVNPFQFVNKKVGYARFINPAVESSQKPGSLYLRSEDQTIWCMSVIKRFDSDMITQTDELLFPAIPYGSGENSNYMVDTVNTPGVIGMQQQSNIVSSSCKSTPL